MFVYLLNAINVTCNVVYVLVIVLDVVVVLDDDAWLVDVVGLGVASVVAVLGDDVCLVAVVGLVVAVGVVDLDDGVLLVDVFGLGMAVVVVGGGVLLMIVVVGLDVVVVDRVIFSVHYIKIFNLLLQGYFKILCTSAIVKFFIFTYLILTDLDTQEC